MLKRFVTLLMVGLLMAAFLAGCGKKQETQMEETTPAQTAEQQAPTTTDTAMADTGAAQQDTAGGK